MAEELDKNLSEQLGKVEHFITENKKSLLIISASVIALIAIFFAYTQLYLAPREVEAADQMFQAERYFSIDSLDKAINGDGNFDGFVAIIENYSGTKSANLANYYLGMAYLKKGKFEEAIESLESFDSDDLILAPLALGAIGDAYSELNQNDKAISYYKKAVKQSKNNFTAPMFLMKQALLCELENDNEAAVAAYKTIKTEFNESAEARDIDKYIARAEAKMN